MRDEIDYIEARDSLLLQEIHSVRILLAVDRHQHVGAIHFLLSRRLDMQDGALDDALEAQCRLGVDLVLAGNRGRVFIDEVGQVLAQTFRLAAAGA